MEASEGDLWLQELWQRHLQISSTGAPETVVVLEQALRQLVESQAPSAEDNAARQRLLCDLQGVLAEAFPLPSSLHVGRCPRARPSAAPALPRRARPCSLLPCLST